MALTPSEIANKRYELSVEMGNLSEELETILEYKPPIWNELFKLSGKVNAANKAWDSTEMGIREMKLRMRMKQKTIEISALSSLLKVHEMTARNLW